MEPKFVVDTKDKASYSLEEVTNAVILGDAFEVLPKLPPEIADMIFLDPPYFAQRSGYTIYRWNENTTLYIWDEEWDNFESFEEYDKFMERLLVECKRLMKPNATIWVMGSYQNIFRVGTIMQNLGFWFLAQFVWVKVNPTPHFWRRRPANATEFLLWAVKDKSVKNYTYNYRYAQQFSQPKYKIPTNIWELPTCNGNRNERLKDEHGKPLHPTQKPEALLERAILISTNEGDLVLDPMAGTGTTAAAAIQHRRRYILIEKEEKYVQGILQRLRRKLSENALVQRLAP